MSLPTRFCWSKFGAEAGESFGHILARKEQERCKNGGIFMWGIGNSIGPSLRCLAQMEQEPEVIFSPIRSSPKPQDVSPPKILVWTAAETADGRHFSLPEYSIVTSRSDEHGVKRCHYALICESSAKLQIDLSKESVFSEQLRNIRTGRPIGSSQVTAIVQQIDPNYCSKSVPYRVAMRARLAHPYFVTLKDPLVIPRRNWGTFLGEGGESAALLELVQRYRQGRTLPLFAAATRSTH